MSEHAVIVRFVIDSSAIDSLFELEDALEEAIGSASVGEYDGNDISHSGHVTLYMYGPNADEALTSITCPGLRRSFYRSYCSHLIRMNRTDTDRCRLKKASAPCPGVPEPGRRRHDRGSR